MPGCTLTIRLYCQRRELKVVFKVKWREQYVKGDGGRNSRREFKVVFKVKWREQYVKCDGFG